MYSDACRMVEKSLLKSLGEAGQVKPRAQENEGVVGVKLEVEEHGD
jgi:hypothetical protein